MKKEEVSAIVNLSKMLRNFCRFHTGNSLNAAGNESELYYQRIELLKAYIEFEAG